MSKFTNSYMTNAGKKLMFGGGQVTYTRAALFTQDVSAMSVDAIRKLDALDGQILSANVGIASQRPQDNGNSTIKVEATFSNAGQKQDAKFASVGWFAKTASTSETLIAVCEVEGGILGAGDPSGASTASINASVNITIGDSTTVTALVDPSGTVTKTVLDSELASKANSSDVTNIQNTLQTAINDAKNTAKSSADNLQSQITTLNGQAVKKIGLFPNDLNFVNGKFTDYSVQTQATPDKNGYALIDLNDDANADAAANELNTMLTNQNNLRGLRSVTGPDFNSLTDTGPYYVMSPEKGKNNPDGGIWGVLFVANGQGHRISQLYFPDDDSYPYYRICYEGTWKGWVRFASQDNISNLQNQINNLPNQVKHIAETASLDGNSDANKITDTGIYRINGTPIKNGDDKRWVFLVVLQWDMNTIQQYLVGGNGNFAYRNISVIYNLYPDWTDPLATLNNSINTKANASDVTSLQSTINTQAQTIASLQATVNDLTSQIAYIKANYVQGKRFASGQEAAAEQWENSNPNGIAFVEK